MADDEIPQAPAMTPDETKEYRTELRNELAELEFAQMLHPSDYKMERINRLRQRLDMEPL